MQNVTLSIISFLKFKKDAISITNAFNDTISQLSGNSDLPEGFAYAYASDSLDECISDVNVAAAEYWASN